MTRKGRRTIGIAIILIMTAVIPSVAQQIVYITTPIAFEPFAAPNLVVALFALVYSYLAYTAVRKERLLSNQLVLLKELVDAINTITDESQINQNRHLVLSRLSMLPRKTLDRLGVVKRCYLGNEVERLEREDKCRRYAHFREDNEKINTVIYKYYKPPSLSDIQEWRQNEKPLIDYENGELDFGNAAYHYNEDHNSCFYIAPGKKPKLNPVPLPKTYRDVMLDEIIETIKELNAR